MVNSNPLPTGNPYRWTGNVFVAVALVLMVFVLIDWIAGWATYCWALARVDELSDLYGVTLGAIGFLAIVLRRFKLGIALLLPGFFPIIWHVFAREIGFTPACVF